MLVYYRLSGFNAVVSIGVNLLLLLGLMAYIGVVMTLPAGYTAELPKPANLQLPDSFVDRPTFGQSLSALPARQAQLAIRITF